mgnify:CR=1 FL=1
MHAKPTAKPEDREEEEGRLVPSEEMDLVPVGVMAEEKKDDGEIMDTANARYYSDYSFRPVYTYRRVQSNRRRVYVPRRRFSSYDDGDRFPTVA